MMFFEGDVLEGVLDGALKDVLADALMTLSAIFLAMSSKMFLKALS